MEYKRVKRSRSLVEGLKTLALHAPYTGSLFRGVFNRPDVEDKQKALTIMKLVQQRTVAKGARFLLIFLPRTKECLSHKYSFDISNFDYVDVMDSFPSGARELARLRFKNDRHWNAEGHKVTATAIVTALVENRIVDERYLRNPSVQ